MKKIMFCLCLVMLAAPCLTQVESAVSKDCFTQHTTQTITRITPDVCANEDVVITIRLSQTRKVCVNEDGTITSRVHLHYHGTGFGARSNNEYVINSQNKEVIIDNPGCEFIRAEKVSIKLISKGSLPNQQMIEEGLFIIGSDCEGMGVFSFELICHP